MAEGREALRVELAAGRRRIDRAHARRAGRRGLGPVRAAEDVEEGLAAAQRLAHPVRILDAIPDHRDARLGCRRGRAARGKRGEHQGDQDLHPSSIRATSRPSAYFTPTMRPFRRARSRYISLSSPRAPNWLEWAAIDAILSSMVSLTST